jgi:hypothetical protein
MTLPLALGLSATIQQLPIIQLPQDTKAAVITMDLAGGFGPRRKDNRPALTILADGTVQVVDRSGVVPAIENKLSSEELQDLLRFAINEHHFFDFDQAKAEREAAAQEEKTGYSFSVFDVATTMVRIRTAERDHNAQFYALDEYARAYPEVKVLTHLLAVVVRLRRLLYEVKAGGQEGVAAALNLGNEYLKTAYPRIPPLRREDFLYVTQYSLDRRTLVFVPTTTRPKQPETAEARMRRMIMPEPELSVEVEFINGAEPKIKVNNPPQ